MPKIVEGLVRATIYLAVIAVVAALTVSIIMNLSYVSDLLDDISMRLTGFPAKQTAVSSETERVAAVFVPLTVAAGAFGILVVYFVHRPRR